MRMSLQEKLYYFRHNPSDIKYLAEEALDSTNERKLQDLFGTTSSWMIACRFENICYQALADYCY